MAKVKTSIINESTVVADAQATPPRCAHCGSQTHAAALFAPLSEHALAAAQRRPDWPPPSTASFSSFRRLK